MTAPHDPNTLALRFADPSVQLGDLDAEPLRPEADLRASCKDLRRELRALSQGQLEQRLFDLGQDLGTWMAEASKTCAALAKQVPAQESDRRGFTRLFVESEDPAVHEVLFEAIDVRSADPASPTAVFPLLTERWSIARTDGRPAAPREPLTHDARLLLVLGSHTMAANQVGARTTMVEMLERVAGSGSASAVLAAPRDELEFLLDPSRVDPTSALGQWVRDRHRCVEVQSTDALLTLLAGDPAAEASTPFELVAFVGHSHEGNNPNLDTEALGLDLGYAATPGGGPSFEQLRDTLAAHGKTRALALFACNIGPTAGLQMLDAAEHTVLTCARLGPEHAAQMVPAWIQALGVDQQEVAAAVRATRRAAPLLERWIVQHWTRSTTRRIFADPQRTALEEFRAREQLEADRHRQKFAGGTTLGVELELRLPLMRMAVPEQLRHDAAADPVTIAEPASARGDNSGPAGERPAGSSLVRILADLFVKTEGAAGRHLVITAAPGAGKTVMLQRARSLLAGAKDDRVDTNVRSAIAGLTPVFVRLKDWLAEGAPADVLKYVVQCVGSTGRGTESLGTALTAEHDRGRLVFLLDGLDEVVPTEQRDLARDRIELLSRGPCAVIVTSRILGYQPLLRRAGDRDVAFPRLTLLGLDADRRKQLIEARLEATGRAAEFDRTIESIEGSATSSPAIARMIANPLLLTQITDLVARGENLDRQPVAVLRQIIDGYIKQKWKPTPERRVLPSVTQKIVAELALKMTTAHIDRLPLEGLEHWIEDQPEIESPTEPSWSEWLEEFGREPRDPELGQLSGASEILGTIGERSGLFAVADGEIAFCHRAFQEALTAEAMRHRKVDPAAFVAEVLRGAEGLDYWAEPLAYYAGMMRARDSADWLLTLVEDGRTRQVAIRAFLNVAKLEAGPIRHFVARLEDWKDRVMVYESLPELTPNGAAALIRELARSDAATWEDLWHLDDVLARVEGDDSDPEQRTELFEDLPAPDPVVWGTVPGRDTNGEFLDFEEGHRRLAAWRSDDADNPCPLEFAWKRIPSTIEVLGEGLRFAMGSPEEEPGRDSNETIVHVQISEPYWALATTVTTQMLEAGVDDGMPARATWFRGSSVCRWLTKHRRQIWARWSRLGRGGPNQEQVERSVFRLPTEAEWEWMCRAGTSTAFWNGTGLIQSTEPDEGVGWWHGNSKFQLHPVARLRANDWGLFDVHGNQWEWCRDWYRFDRDAVVDPLGPRRGSYRVLRGGAYGDTAGRCRSAARFGGDPAWVDFGGGGFRPVFAAPLPSSARPIEDRS